MHILTFLLHLKVLKSTVGNQQNAKGILEFFLILFLHFQPSSCIQFFSSTSIKNMSSINKPELSPIKKQYKNCAEIKFICLKFYDVTCFFVLFVLFLSMIRTNFVQFKSYLQSEAYRLVHFQFFYQIYFYAAPSLPSSFICIFPVFSKLSVCLFVLNSQTHNFLFSVPELEILKTE